MTKQIQTTIIEFTGLPNSGKTTLIHNVAKLLANDGFKVKIMQEDAELVPSEIPKKTWVRNVWITFGQLQSLLEIPYLLEYDVILLDRGYYDAIFWANFLYTLGVCSKEESDSLLKILDEMSQTFSLLPDELFVIDVSIEESIRRRYAFSSKIPTLTNREFLTCYKEELSSFYKNIKSPIKYLDTTDMSVSDVAVISHKLITDIIA